MSDTKDNFKIVPTSYHFRGTANRVADHIATLEAENALLTARVGELEAALKYVYDDCKIRAVDGVVPIGNGCWTKLCKTLEGVEG
jgi:hypothetical protein